MDKEREHSVVANQDLCYHVHQPWVLAIVLRRHSTDEGGLAELADDTLYDVVTCLTWKAANHINQSIL